MSGSPIISRFRVDLSNAISQHWEIIRLPDTEYFVNLVQVWWCLDLHRVRSGQNWHNKLTTAIDNFFAIQTKIALDYFAKIDSKIYEKLWDCRKRSILKGILYFVDWTGVDWICKTGTCKTRTCKTRTCKTRICKARTCKTRTCKTTICKTRTCKTRTWYFSLLKRYFPIQTTDLVIKCVIILNPNISLASH